MAENREIIAVQDGHHVGSGSLWLIVSGICCVASLFALFVALVFLRGPMATKLVEPYRCGNHVTAHKRLIPLVAKETREGSTQIGAWRERIPLDDSYFDDGSLSRFRHVDLTFVPAHDIPGTEHACNVIVTIVSMLIIQEGQYCVYLEAQTKDNATLPRMPIRVWLQRHVQVPREIIALDLMPHDMPHYQGVEVLLKARDSLTVAGPGAGGDIDYGKVAIFLGLYKTEASTRSCLLRRGTKISGDRIEKSPSARTDL